MRSPISTKLLATTLLLIASNAWAHTGVPQCFTSNMVLQRNQANRVFGWGDAGDNITVQIAKQTKKTKVNDDGRWEVSLDPMQAGGPHRLTISGHNKLEFDNVMIGEVWICSGQSNMAWPVSRANDPDLEAMTANFPNIRLLSVPQVGTDEPQDDFDGEWKVCTPQTVSDFSAVGYFFGRQLHLTLDVPIGLIDNAWGGSACEAWINRETFAKDGRFDKLNEHWKQIEANAAEDDAENSAQLRRQLRGNQRPANIYNGVLHPTIGYGIRGAIWYQGESNASRAHQYRDLFPFMIQTWRDEWQQGDFPFYWVQLADFMQEKPEPADSDWAELREAQTMTMSKLPNTGEAVIIDIGEANDIHPTNKQDVAKRLARWALARDYGFDGLAYRSPTYKSMEQADGHIVVTLDHVGSGLDTLDVNEVRGFSIAGEDQKFHNAKAEIIGKGRGRTQVKVWSDTVKLPVAVRYAWADNPVCNLRSFDGLPATPFRTDSWPGGTVGRRTR